MVCSTERYGDMRVTRQRRRGTAFELSNRSALLLLRVLHAARFLRAGSQMITHLACWCGHVKRTLASCSSPVLNSHTQELSSAPRTHNSSRTICCLVCCLSSGAGAASQFVVEMGPTVNC